MHYTLASWFLLLMVRHKISFFLSFLMLKMLKIFWPAHLVLMANANSDGSTEHVNPCEVITLTNSSDLQSLEANFNLKARISVMHFTLTSFFLLLIVRHQISFFLSFLMLKMLIWLGVVYNQANTKLTFYSNETSKDKLSII